MENQIKNVYVRESALEYSRDILKKLGGNYTVINDEDKISGGKETLLLSYKKGGFVKKCPCSNDSISCGYYNINLIQGCFFDCSYCILQLYLKDTPITLFTNIDDLFLELENVLHTQGFIRIGPGELADSLCLESITGYSAKLIDFFKDKNALLEIKTKDHRIDSLLNINHGGKTVISFSLNTKTVINNEEKYASTLEQRINAAKKAVKKGYFVAFHFDPVVIYPECEDEYEKVIKMISANVDAEKIKWISLGSLRFPYALKPLIREMHRNSKILTGELVKCKQGKMRYFYFIRRQIYKLLLENINKYFNKVPVYFCMETPEIWKNYPDLSKNLKILNNCCI